MEWTISLLIKAFYSDPHFGHDNIRLPDYANRPFSSVKAMEYELIDRYNELIKPHDVCLWLGDTFFCKKEQAESIMRRLYGHKILIRGGHDKGANWLADIGFDLVIETGYLVFQIGGRRARACHYPYWEKGDRHDESQKPLYTVKRKGEVLIHGHSHRTTPLHGNQIDAGVDAWNYGPALWSEVEQFAWTI